MQRCALFQTLEDRGDDAKVELEGPYKCVRDDAWLGEGYYMWEHDIELARRWGKKCGHEKYVIGQSAYDFETSMCFDLYNNPLHRDMLKVTYARIVEVVDDQKTVTVAVVLDRLKALMGDDFYFLAIRSKSEYVPVEKRVFYGESHREWMTIVPDFQLCILHKSFLIEPFKIVEKGQNPQVRMIPKKSIMFKPFGDKR